MRNHGVDATARGNGTILTEGPGWAAPARDEAVREACAELGVIYDAVPHDGRDHLVRVRDDTTSLVQDRESDEEEGLRWRRNEHRLGSICHREGSSTVTNGLLGRGLVCCFDNSTSREKCTDLYGSVRISVSRM